MYMRIFFTILILTLSFQASTNADDIRDFQIEGISIGDSALEFFDKKEIEERKKIGFVYTDKTFFSATFYNKDFFEKYHNIQLHLKANDSKYIIYSVAGKINYKDNYNECVNEMEKILPELKVLFSEARFFDDGTEIWTNNEGYKVKTKSYFLELSDGSNIALECYDQPKEMNIIDGLSIAIDSDEFVEFLTTD